MANPHGRPTGPRAGRFGRLPPSAATAGVTAAQYAAALANGQAWCSDGGGHFVNGARMATSYASICDMHASARQRARHVRRKAASDARTITATTTDGSVPPRCEACAEETHQANLMGPYSQYIIAPASAAPVRMTPDEAKRLTAEGAANAAELRARQKRDRNADPIADARRAGFAAGVEAAARHVEAHSCVASCCDAQPGGDTAKALAACVRAIDGGGAGEGGG